MSFKLRKKRVTTDRPPEREAEVWVRFNAPHGHVRFSRGALKAMDVDFGCRVEILMGEGEDEGRLAFRREAEGNGYILSKHQTVDLFSLLRGFRLRETVTIAGDIRDGMVVVDLRPAMEQAVNKGAPD